MSDTVLIVNAVLAFLGTVFSGIVAYFIAKLNRQQTAAAVKVEEVAARVAATATLAEEVKQDLVAANLNITGTLLDVAAKVEEVHKATNSLTDRLIETTAKEALQRGGIEERERAARQEDRL